MNTSNAPVQHQQQKIEMIKQYYNQLSSNIKSLAAQLAVPDLAPIRRAALQQQYDRLQASMVEFTDKVLKPLMSGGGAGAASFPRPVPTANSGAASPNKRKPNTAPPTVPGMTGGFQAAQQQQHLFQQRMLALNTSNTPNNNSAIKKPQVTAPIAKIKSLLQPDLPKLISESMSLAENSNDLDAYIGNQDDLVDWILCDTMIDQVCEEACRGALLRQSDTVTARDLAFALRRVYPISPLLGRNTSLIPVKRLSANHPHTIRLAQMKRQQQRLLSNISTTSSAPENASN